MNAVERGVVLSRGEYLDEAELSLILPEQARGAPPAANGAAAAQASPGPQGGGGETAAGGIPSAAAHVAPGGQAPSLEAVERQTILRTLEAAGGNKSEAARRLGITRRTLHQKLRKYGMM
jgi:two-component system response regulator HydG